MRGLILIVVLGLAVSGCSSAPSKEEAQAAADAFFAKDEMTRRDSKIKELEARVIFLDETLKILMKDVVTLDQVVLTNTK